ncbi:MAG: galactitol-1-phosphate 5-dehydrogenase [Candidatus Hydrogenedentota bacterium]
MRALVLEKYKRLEIQDRPVPEYGPNDVLMHVRACAICGSDVHGYDGSSGRRIPPIVMGHEAAGEVANVGKAVTRLKPGDRVTFDSTIYCGKCAFCRSGRVNLCDNRVVLGVSCEDYRRDGAFAEYVAVPEHIVYPIPDDLRFEHASLVEPVSVAIHAVSRAPIRLNDSAVVVGAGTIGLLALQALKLAGCGRVVVVDIEDGRLRLAQQLGATHTINAAHTPVPNTVLSLTEGKGADLVLEAVGAENTVGTSLACVRKGGTVVLVGNVTPNVSFPLQSAVTREITVLGSCAISGEYPAAIDLLSRGDMVVEPLISAKVPLEKGPEWFERLYNRESGLLKVVLCP